MTNEKSTVHLKLNLYKIPGKTGLLLAASDGQQEIVEELLKNKADIEAKSTNTGKFT